MQSILGNNENSVFTNEIAATFFFFFFVLPSLLCRRSHRRRDELLLKYAQAHLRTAAAVKARLARASDLKN